MLKQQRQQNSKLWREKDEMVTLRVSKCSSKVTQNEYKTKHD